MSLLVHFIGESSDFSFFHLIHKYAFMVDEKITNIEKEDTCVDNFLIFLNSLFKFIIVFGWYFNTSFKYFQCMDLTGLREHIRKHEWYQT